MGVTFDMKVTTDFSARFAVGVVGSLESIVGVEHDAARLAI